MTQLLRKVGMISLVGGPPCGKRKPGKRSFSPFAYTHGITGRQADPVMMSATNCQTGTTISSWQGFPFATYNYVTCSISKNDIAPLLREFLVSFPRPPGVVKALTTHVVVPFPRTSWVMTLRGALGERTLTEKLGESGRSPVNPLTQQGIATTFSRHCTHSCGCKTE